MLCLCVALWASTALTARAEGPQFNQNCASLAWNANSEPDLSGYRIYDRVTQSVGRTQIASMGQQLTSISCASLSFNPGQHYVSISAIDLTGNEGAISADVPFVIVTDNSISDFRVTIINATDMMLAFTEVDDGAGAPASYDVRFKTPTMDWGTASSVSSGTCSTPLAGTTVGATKTCTVTGLSTTTPYEFQIIPYRGTIGVDAIYGPLSNVTGGTTGGTVEDLADRVVIVSDGFTQANGTLGLPWEGGYLAGSVTNPSFQVVSNRIRTSNIVNDHVMAHTATLPNDQWCEFTIPTLTGGGVIAPRCLLSVGAVGALNGYEFTALVGYAGTKSRIGKWVSGSFTTTLVSEDTSVWVAGDVLRAEKRAGVLTMFRNDVQILSVADATYSGGRGGLMLFVNTAVGNLEVDDVRFGEFAVAGADPCGCN